MSLKNKVLLIGNVGKDTEVKHLASGSVVANVTLATSEKYTDKSGVKKEVTEWHNLIFWDNSAKLIEQFVKKGDKLSIEGALRTESYEKDGQKHYRTKIQVENFLFLTPNPNSSTTTTTNTNISQDDLPY